ncbi:hypothetical protein EAI_08923 [Harpegnathos saltator]|uniref:OSK domain-containing protein n=1 Tax=Harpegnathos saltator TaxID=610380 RepID=E2BYH0_HARSA|nr:hypothetical protein EAI_08923 [Harpegnathos saltator]
MHFEFPGSLRNKYYKQFTRQKSSFDHDDERKYKIKKVYSNSNNRVNKRMLSFNHRDPTYFNSGDRNISFDEEEENHHPVVIETNELKTIGATCDEMIDDMSELLQVLQSKFHLSNSAITICTIPPLANIAIHAYKYKSLALFCFNNWIRSLVDDMSRRDSFSKGYRILDLFENCSNEMYATEFDWFQTQARRVSGTKHSYVLWNNKGRKLAMNLICGEKNMEPSENPDLLPTP